MTVIVGVDCATVPKKRGIAIGRIQDNTCLITNVAIGMNDKIIASIVKELGCSCNQMLLALDAPLGWPAPMGRALAAHKAGEPLSILPRNLFRRETDRFIREKLNKQSLDVGADRIARTAHAALHLLAQISEVIGYQVPLAWCTEFSGVAAIEVYPAATLRSYCLPDSGYKTPSAQSARKKIIDGLKKVAGLSLKRPIDLPIQSADALDAVICCIAGVDFLRGSVHRPIDAELACKEGWIWVRI